MKRLKNYFTHAAVVAIALAAGSLPTFAASPQPTALAYSPGTTVSLTTALLAEDQKLLGDMSPVNTTTIGENYDKAKAAGVATSVLGHSPGAESASYMTRTRLAAALDTWVDKKVRDLSTSSAFGTDMAAARDVNPASGATRLASKVADQGLATGPYRRDLHQETKAIELASLNTAVDFDKGPQQS